MISLQRNRSVLMLLACLLVLVCLQLLLPLSAFAKQRKAWRRYMGAWFSIDYPANFAVRRGLKSNAGDDKSYDSAFFAAADKSVEFYVFSPMHDGEPKDILVNNKTEIQVSSKTENKKEKDGFDSTTRVIWVTIRARNGRYTRSYMDLRGDGMKWGGFTRRVFGIKYTNQKVYERYKQQYLHFQHSLEQYAD
jgi:hypothetical protein